MQRKISFAPNEFYHIYNRGVEKRIIFIDDSDYRHFILLMRYCNSEKNIDIRSLKRRYGRKGLPFVLNDSGETIVDIGAWCLMPNHFHFILREKIDGGITRFIHRITTAYSMYFNKKHKRVGHLFQGIFGSEHVNTDNYLKYLFSYIHLNPVKLIQSDWKDVGIRDLNKAIKYLDGYAYSSYFDYSNKVYNREWGSLLNKQTFPEYFNTKEDFMKEIIDWLKFDPNKLGI
jgi:putative transposase